MNARLVRRRAPTTAQRPAIGEEVAPRRQTFDAVAPEVDEDLALRP